PSFLRFLSHSFLLTRSSVHAGHGGCEHLRLMIGRSTHASYEMSNAHDVYFKDPGRRLRRCGYFRRKAAARCADVLARAKRFPQPCKAFLIPAPKYLLHQDSKFVSSTSDFFARPRPTASDSAAGTQSRM